MAPQQHRPKTSPKDFFLHLLNIITLYITAAGFGRLLFVIINYYFPDPLSYNFQGDFDSIRWAISSIIIGFPVYVLTCRYLNKEYKLDPEKKNLRVKSWLEYFTMFGTAVIILVSFMTVVYYFLGGEITTRFILKVLTMIYIAGMILGYYYYVVRERAEKNKGKVIKIMFWVVSASLLIAIIGGFLTAGSPTRARQMKFDQTRINDLQNIQNEVINYWQRKRALPQDLAQLAKESYFNAPADPETGKPYEYTISDPLTFELCAVFDIGSITAPVNDKYPTPASAPIGYYSGPYQNIYNQPYSAGHDCFSYTINPDLYPPSAPAIK